MTYRQAYDKIIDAYFKDEIQPWKSEFCFCGTLHGNREWNYSVELNSAPYTFKEYKSIEFPLLHVLQQAGYGPYDLVDGDERYEKILFSGMCAALDVLKEIHRARGEDVDGIPELTKRKLSLS